MKKITDWRDAVQMPVIAPRMKKWELNLKNLQKLEDVLSESICRCAETCLKKNIGVIAMTLSGGIDSSFCLWVIRKNFPLSTIHTFTIGESENHSDVLFAREMAGILGTLHEEFIPSNDQIEKAKKEVASLWPGEEERSGNVAVFMVYELMAKHGVAVALAHDGIDEQFGGYWEHRERKSLKETEETFRKLWGRLEKDHLLPLERKAKHFGIEVILPYLQKSVISYISRIPIAERTSYEVSKIPLRVLAFSRGLPKDIIDRRKIGFCDALNKV